MGFSPGHNFLDATRIEVTAPDIAANGSAADVALVDLTARKVSARDDGAVVPRRSAGPAQWLLMPPNRKAR